MMDYQGVNILFDSYEDAAGAEVLLGSMERQPHSHSPNSAVQPQRRSEVVTGLSRTGDGLHVGCDCHGLVVNFS